jgi:excisionase family DNA binding protein
MYTVQDVAERWKCSPQLVYKLVSEGRLQCYKIGSLIRFTDEQLTRYLEDAARVSPRTPAPRKHIR